MPAPVTHSGPKMTETVLVSMVLPFLPPTVLLRQVTMTSRMVREGAFGTWIALASAVAIEKLCALVHAFGGAEVGSILGHILGGVTSSSAAQAYLKLRECETRVTQQLQHDVHIINAAKVAVRDTIARCACREVGLNDRSRFDAVMAQCFGTAMDDDPTLHSQLHGAYWHSMRQAHLRPFPSNNSVAHALRGGPRRRRERVRVQPTQPEENGAAVPTTVEHQEQDSALPDVQDLYRAPLPDAAGCAVVPDQLPSFELPPGFRLAYRRTFLVVEKVSCAQPYAASCPGYFPNSQRLALTAPNGMFSELSSSDVDSNEFCAAPNDSEYGSTIDGEGEESEADHSQEADELSLHEWADMEVTYMDESE